MVSESLFHERAKNFELTVALSLLLLGSHIKGLIINFFEHFWPHLIRPAVDAKSNDDSTFLSSFITPLLKARKGIKEVISFYSEPDFNRWKTSIGSDLSKWKIKYYKGLGTSTQAEAKEVRTGSVGCCIGCTRSTDQTCCSTVRCSKHLIGMCANSTGAQTATMTCLIWPSRKSAQLIDVTG